MTSRAVIVAAIAGAALSLPAVPANAHNGTGAAFKGAAGAYTVYAYDGYAIPGGRLAYRLVLLDRRYGDPAEDVTVAVAAHPPGAAAPLTTANVEVTNNVVFYDLPNPYPHDWQVSVDLRGRLGRGHATFAMHGQAPYEPAVIQPIAPSGGSDNSLLVGAIAAAAGCAAVVSGLVWRRRRRR
ncbi:MAG: hypothetical protein JO074_06635 [Frankiales bacterium]|nr:hypothetical protein [Frankiales bacterium]